LKVRTGFGYDIHRLREGKPLFLGGVRIPFPKGLVGHSDGDCLIHAVIDALLGAAGEKDIGGHFPDTDPRYKNIRSTLLLEDVMTLLRTRRFEVVNVDTVILAEKPKLASYISAMKEILCPLLGIDPRSLAIKSKTNEGMGVIGRGGAVAAWAVVLIEEKRRRRDRPKKVI